MNLGMGVIENEITFYKINRILKRIERQEYSVVKTFQYYRKKYDDENSDISFYLSELLKDVYLAIDNNSELSNEEKSEIAKRLKEFYENKIDMETIDKSLFNENIIRMGKSMEEKKVETTKFYNETFNM